jgi:inhibitor of KinA
MKKDFTINFQGDSTLVIKLGENIDYETNKIVHNLFNNLERDICFQDYIYDIYPTFNNIVIDYDNLLTDFETLKADITKKIYIYLKNYQSDVLENQITEIPVSYGGLNGPDLKKMSNELRISEEEIIEIHSSTIYRIFMIGFMPGFPYLGGLDKRISFPRLSTPRIAVPEGSVGIAGMQTGIYPFDSPGGWNIIGRTEKKLFNTMSNPPALLPSGSNLKFIRI